MQVVWDDQTIRVQVARAVGVTDDDVSVLMSTAVNGALCAVYSVNAEYDSFRCFVPLKEFAESVLGKRVQAVFDPYNGKGAIVLPEV